MTKFKINVFAMGPEPRIGTIEITRETEHSYWTKKTPDRWNESTEWLHQKRVEPVWDTFAQAKAEWIRQCRDKIVGTEYTISVYQNALVVAKNDLAIAEAIHE